MVCKGNLGLGFISSSWQMHSQDDPKNLHLDSGREEPKEMAMNRPKCLPSSGFVLMPSVLLSVLVVIPMSLLISVLISVSMFVLASILITVPISVPMSVLRTQLQPLGRSVTLLLDLNLKFLLCQVHCSPVVRAEAVGTPVGRAGAGSTTTVRSGLVESPVGDRATEGPTSTCNKISASNCHLTLSTPMGLAWPGWGPRANTLARDFWEGEGHVSVTAEHFQPPLWFLGIQPSFLERAPFYKALTSVV